MNLVEQLIDDESLETLLRTHIKALGLTKGIWSFSRGQKLERIYTEAENGVINIKISHIYEYEDESDNKERTVKSDAKLLEWIDSEGSVIQSRTIDGSLNFTNKRDINEKIRKNRIGFLESQAQTLADLAETLPEPTKSQYLAIAGLIDAIFDVYSQEIYDYETRNKRDFEDVITSDYNYVDNGDPEDEINTIKLQIKSIWDVIVVAPDSKFPIGMTVHQSILYQLNGTIPQA